METKVVLQDGMAFTAHIDGFEFTIDASPRVGGQDRGPRPKGLTLISLAGCTAMDVVSILRKMKQDVTGFSVEVGGELADEHPRKFDAITVRYRLEGNIDPDRARRAVALSEDRYCGVSATLKPGVPMQTEIWINGERLEA